VVVEIKKSARDARRENAYTGEQKAGKMGPSHFILPINS
jgi:hypothetical protein